tara:strand:- start:203 stop:418 length:216 start_codon:yes stop_codon:yes gene_type:complete
MNTKDTYLTDEGLEFEFIVWEDYGDYYTPSYHSVEIIKINYKDTDVTDLLFNIADEYVDNIRRKLDEKIDK